MRRNISGWVIMVGIIFFYACNSQSKTSADNKLTAENKILQQKDGSISLKVDKAECYSDMDNPSSNTAEWNVRVSKSGRFNVWISSATKDTTDLKYKNSVMLSVQDYRLEAIPACDKIIMNSADVSYPYFRADSFMGSLFIQDTGLYNIQIISEKILPKGVQDSDTAKWENTKLLSVMLTPTTR